MNIKRIESDLNTINEIQKNKENMEDPYMIDVMGYHVQQAIEKSIKYFFNNVYGEKENTRKFKVHSLLDLIDYLDEFDKNFIQNHEDLVEMADEITGWEVSSRYDDVSCADYDSVMKSIKIANDLYNEIVVLENNMNTKNQLQLS